MKTPGKLYKLISPFTWKPGTQRVAVRSATDEALLHIPFGSIGMFVGDSEVYEKFLVSERLILLTASEKNLCFEWVPFEEEEVCE